VSEPLKADDPLQIKLSALLGPIESIVPLRGGTGGDSFIVSCRGRRLHVKRVAIGSSRSLDLGQEYALLEQLEDAAISAPPLAFDSMLRVIVTEYLDGYAPLAAAELMSGERLAEVCALLSRLHVLRAVLPGFSPVDVAAGYIDACGGLDALADREQALASELFEAGNFYARRFEACTVCHGDLVSANIIFGADARLVDFEYAQLAAPVLDLASLSTMNGFTADDDERMLGCYFVAESAPFSYEEFVKVRRLVALIAHFWARAQTSMTPDVRRFVVGSN
jgi:aminoglycoside phosphotransferase (APT) family kinase protein